MPIRSRQSARSSRRPAPAAPVSTASFRCPTRRRRLSLHDARRISMCALAMGSILCAGALLAGPVVAAPVSGNDENGPLVQIIRPGYNDVLKGKYRILIAVTAKKYNPQSVEMFVDDKTATGGPVPLSSLASSSFDWDTRSFGDGKHKLTVRVTDAQGFTGWAEVTVFVNNGQVVDSSPPDLKWVGIEPFQQLSGQVQLEVGAGDNFGVKLLQILINPIDTPNRTPAMYSWLLNQPPYRVNWDTVAKRVPDGLYSVKALAFDSADQQGEAPPLTIGVVNNAIDATTIGEMLKGLREMSDVEKGVSKVPAPTQPASTPPAPVAPKTPAPQPSQTKTPAETGPVSSPVVTVPLGPGVQLKIAPPLSGPRLVPAPANPGINVPKVTPPPASQPKPQSESPAQTGVNALVSPRIAPGKDPLELPTPDAFASAAPPAKELDSPSQTTPESAPNTKATPDTKATPEAQMPPVAAPSEKAVESPSATEVEKTPVETPEVKTNEAKVGEAKTGDVGADAAKTGEIPVGEIAAPGADKTSAQAQVAAPATGNATTLSPAVEPNAGNVVTSAVPAPKAGEDASAADAAVNASVAPGAGQTPGAGATAPNATAPNATASNATAPNATAPNATAPNATAPNATAPNATAQSPAEMPKAVADVSSTASPQAALPAPGASRRVAELPRPLSARFSGEPSLSRFAALDAQIATPEKPRKRAASGYATTASAPQGPRAISVARLSLPGLGARRFVGGAPVLSQTKTGDGSRVSRIEVARRVRLAEPVPLSPALAGIARAIRVSAPTLIERALTQPSRLVRQTKAASVKTPRATGVSASKAVVTRTRVKPIEIAPAAPTTPRLSASQAPGLSIEAPSPLAKAVPRAGQSPRIAALPRPDKNAAPRRNAITIVPVETPLQVEAVEVPASYQVERTMSLRAVAAKFALPVELVALSNDWPADIKLLKGTTVKLPRPLQVSYNGAPVAGEVPAMLLGATGVTAFRFLFEQSGGTLKWDAPNQRVVAHKGDQEIVLNIGSKIAKIGDREVAMELAAFLFEGRTMVPIRFFEESLNAQVDWNPQTGRLVVAMAG